MAQHFKVEPSEAKKLKDAGWTHARIAEKYGLTVSGVQQLLGSYGHVQKYVSHKDAHPWTADKKHSASTVYLHFRNLSFLSQGKPIRKNEKTNQYQTRASINWANRLIDQGLDVDYDRDEPPNDLSSVGGYFTKEADPENWHLRDLMQRVIAAQTRKLQ